MEPTERPAPKDPPAGADDPRVVHQAERERYVLVHGDEVLAVAEYVDRDGTRVFTHTVVPPRLEGRGHATRLVRAALADTGRAGRRVAAQCWFVRDLLERTGRVAPT